MTSAPPASGPPAQPASAGKFRFEPDEVEDIAKQWLNLARDYNPSLLAADELVMTTSASSRSTSGRWTRRARPRRSPGI